MVASSFCDDRKSALMARFLKQSFAQTCLEETDNGKLQQFDYSSSLITNRGTVEKGTIHSARALKQNTQTWRAASKRMCFLELCVKNLRDRIIGRIAKNYYAPLGRET